MQNQMFVSNRDIVVRSAKAGMSIDFKKGVPTGVPRIMHAEVMEKGILPVEETGETVKAETGVSLPDEDKPKFVLPPDDGAEFDAKVLEVIKAIVARNSPKDFTGAGIPRAKTISAVLGYGVDQKDVNRVWVANKPDLVKE